MKKRSEIKEKLAEAEEAYRTGDHAEQQRIATVILTLMWVLEVKITSEPKDPVAEKEPE